MTRPRPHQFWRSSALPFVECRRASDSTACYAPHAHPTLSLGAVDGGTSSFQRGQCRRTLIQGDVVFIPAEETHACNPAKDGAWSYQMLYLDPAWVSRILREFLGEFPGEFDAPHSGIDCRPQPKLPGAALYARLTEMTRALFGPASDEDKEAWLLAFVGDVFAAEKARTLHPAVAGDSALGRVKELIAAHYRETLSLAQLAAEAGLSRYHLLRAFRDWTGMTPHAWQLDLRIQHARQLLKEDRPLADIAFSLGFADQSHFQRAFKQRVAATPGDYRRLQQRNFIQD